MSSLADLAGLSDAPAADVPSSSAAAAKTTADRRRAQRSSSARLDSRSSPRPFHLPSESAGPLSDVDGFLDDDRLAVEQSLRRQRANARPDIPRVVDTIGETVGRRFETFLEEYTSPLDEDDLPLSSVQTQDSAKFYIQQVRYMQQENLSTLYVDFEHLMAHDNNVTSDAIRTQYYRHLPFLTRALNNIIAKYEPRYFREHRQPDSVSTSAGADSSVGANATSQAQSSQMGGKTTNQQTDKIFTLAFYNMPAITRIRRLRTDQVGRLLSFSGTVTRTSEVRPELHLGTFVCENCQNVVPNVEQTFRYTEPQQCPNLTCNNKDAWRLDIRQSTFLDWQKIRVQENSSEIPTGSMPRTLDVIVRGEMVDRAKAGEKCIFTGTLIAIPDVSQFRVPGRTVQAQRDGGNAPRGAEIGGGGVTGLKTLGVRDLTYRLAFLSCMIRSDKRSAGQAATRLHGLANKIMHSLEQVEDRDPFESSDEAQEAYLATLSTSEIAELKMMVHTPNIYARLVDSLAPMVYGHEIVKKGLLLQLLGGVSKHTPEGMALRGDINVCIVGDPSTSKSQFLKYICSILPRAVYTSGKASSAAGLTAAVVKDEETGDFTIEAGALMLADNGICCIDEFDKMDLADQVAIHEAMEQQTISIAKAGIQATLNARTSILAAANPVGGRYNRRTTLRANINMSAPIMSRFDLFFVVLDECNESVDRHLARHIVGIHALRDEAVRPEFSTEQLQRYIRFARTFKPEFLPEAKAELVARYKELRADDAQGGVGRNSYRITVRQLESMIRLSEAIAKANCVTEVTSEFVQEAFKLLRQSIISVERDDVDVGDEDDDDDDDNDGNGDGRMRATTAVDDDDDGDDDNADGQGMEDGDERDGGDDDDIDRRRARRTGSAQPPPPPRTQITHDKWSRMVRMFATRIAADEADEERRDGVERDELVLWYLERIEDELATEADMERERRLAGKVLRRMARDGMLMAVRGEGLADGDGGGLGLGGRGGADEDDDDEGNGGQQGRRTAAGTVVYCLHPNFSVEDVV